MIGGSGHIGTFLVPRLVLAGHEVVSISRGSGREARRRLAARRRGRPDPLHRRVRERPVGEYSIAKAATTELLKAETRSGGLATTSIHPGHIVGPGWHAIRPLGNRDPEVWRTLSAGEPLDVPGIGTKFMHHVHADVAQAFEAAVVRRDARPDRGASYGDVGGVPPNDECRCRRGELGHLVQPLRQPREGAYSARVRPAVRAGWRDSRLGSLADRTRPAGCRQPAHCVAASGAADLRGLAVKRRQAVALRSVEVTMYAAMSAIMTVPPLHATGVRRGVPATDFHSSSTSSPK